MLRDKNGKSYHSRQYKRPQTCTVKGKDERGKKEKKKERKQRKTSKRKKEKQKIKSNEGKYE